MAAGRSDSSSRMPSRSQHLGEMDAGGRLLADRGSRSRRPPAARRAARRRRRSAAPGRRPHRDRRLDVADIRRGAASTTTVARRARRSAPRSGSGGRPARRRAAWSRIAPTAPNVAVDAVPGLGLERRRQRFDQPLRRAAAQQPQAWVIGASLHRGDDALAGDRQVAHAHAERVEHGVGDRRRRRPVRRLAGAQRRLVRAASRISTSTARHLGEAQDRVGLPGVAGDARRGRSAPPPSASSSSAWIAPPSIWLTTPSGLITSPTSTAMTSRRTRISASPSTSATTAQ